MAKSVSNSEEPSSFNTPRRKPRLAPIRQSDHSVLWRSQDQFNRNSHRNFTTYHSSLLPTRATLVRQSRSRPALSQVFNNINTTSENYLDRNQFSYNINTPSNLLNTHHYPTSCLPFKESVNRKSRNLQSDRTITSSTAIDLNCSNHINTTTRSNDEYDSLCYGCDDEENTVEEEIYDEDYESDADFTACSDVDGQCNSTSRTVNNNEAFWRPNRSSTKPNSLPSSALPLNLDNSDSALPNSPSSEIPEVSSIRSAASHRRAMRLFEEAEKRRQSEGYNINNNLQILSTSSTPVSSVRITKVHSTGLSNNNTATSANRSNSDIDIITVTSSSGPVLTPAVFSAVSSQRLIPGKCSAKRNTNISSESLNDTDHCLPGSTDDNSPKTPTNCTSDNKKHLPLQSHQQQHHLTRHSKTVSTVSTKYNPYVGASFRENREYTGLVIGRAAGTPSIIASTDMHQHYQSIERRPLKGQHNIQSSIVNTGNPLTHPTSADLSASSASSTYTTNNITTTASTTAAGAVPLSTNFNVVGRGLFDQPLSVTNGKSSNILSSSQSLNKLSINTNVNSSGRQTPGNFKHTEYNQLEHGVYHLSKDNELEGSNILLGIGLNDSTNVAAADSSPNIRDIDSKGGTHETCVSHSFRQRILQKKSKKLQKLRDNSTLPKQIPNTSISENSQNPLNPEAGSSAFFLSNDKSYSRLDSTEHPPSHSTWPPPSSNNSRMNFSSIPEETSHKLKSDNKSSGASVLQPTRRRLPAENSLSKNSRSTSQNSVTNTTPTSHSEYSNESMNTNTLCTENPTTVGNDTSMKLSDYDKNPLPDKPLLNKVRAVASLSGTPPTIPSALSLISSDDWEDKVSRQAVQTMGSLFQGLNKAMDPHVDLCIRVLLGKTGETAAAFLRDEVSVIMDEVIQHASPSRTLTALIQHGISHKSPAVRLQTALLVSRIVENLSSHGRMNLSNRSNLTRGSGSGSNSGSNPNVGHLSSWGSTGNLNSVSSANLSSSNSVFLGGFMERLIGALSQFLTDGNQETRYHLSFAKLLVGSFCLIIAISIE
ncbi:Protein FAM179B [Schistosoma japonicum]|nr:Protein FAM179B [Schistosoma japonicum]